MFFAIQFYTDGWLLTKKDAVALQEIKAEGSGEPFLMCTRRFFANRKAYNFTLVYYFGNKIKTDFFIRYDLQETQ